MSTNSRWIVTPFDLPKWVAWSGTGSQGLTNGGTFLALTAEINPEQRMKSFHSFIAVRN